VGEAPILLPAVQPVQERAGRPSFYRGCLTASAKGIEERETFHQRRRMLGVGVRRLLFDELCSDDLSSPARACRVLAARIGQRLGLLSLSAAD
jgi:hypothetical protein